MSAPHDETHEMHSEVATVARAMLSAGLAVADARRQRQLRAARDAERDAGAAHRTRSGMRQRPAPGARHRPGQRRAAHTTSWTRRHAPGPRRVQPTRHSAAGGHDGRDPGKC